MKLLFCSLLLSLSVSAYTQQDSVLNFPVLDAMAIHAGDSAHPVALVNNTSSMLLGETNALSQYAWDGFIVAGREMMKDYAFQMDDLSLRRDEVTDVVVSPYSLTRFYRNGVEENVYFLDSVNALVVDLKNARGKGLSVHPSFSGGTHDIDFSPLFELNVLMISRTNHMVRTTKEDYPATVALSFLNELYSAAAFYESQPVGSYFSPAYISTVKQDTLHRLLITVGDSLKDAYVRLKRVAKNFDQIKLNTDARRAGFISAVSPATADSTTRLAFSWAAAGSAALWSGKENVKYLQQPAGAGAPSIPGSELFYLNGGMNYLRALLALQDTDITRSSYGEIRGSSASSYDVSGWSVLAIDRYVRASADSGLARQLYPSVRRTIDGTLRYRAEQNGQLKHACMDGQSVSLYGSAKKGKAAYAGAQAVWLAQLDAGIRLGIRTGDAASADKWKKIRGRLAKSLSM
ncbi:MAG TPA: hypothetical protein VL633_08895 [Bacteroidota bacterium]|jgi:hypothetical protein|nr:hypothetical protein [Bacteroidota bacterium]